MTMKYRITWCPGPTTGFCAYRDPVTHEKTAHALVYRPTERWFVAIAPTLAEAMDWAVNDSRRFAWEVPS